MKKKLKLGITWYAEKTYCAHHKELSFIVAVMSFFLSWISRACASPPYINSFNKKKYRPPPKISFSPKFWHKKLLVGLYGAIGVLFQHWKSFSWTCLFLSGSTSDPFKNICKLKSFSGHFLVNIWAASINLRYSKFWHKAILKTSDILFNILLKDFCVCSEKVAE